MGRRTILLVTAVVVAALGTALVFLYVKSVDDRANEGQKLVSIIYAKDTIPAGTTLQQAVNESQVATGEFRADQVPDGAIGNAEPLFDKVVTAKIEKGLPILESMLDDSGSAITSDLEDRQTAVALNLQAQQRLGGTLQPQDWVYLFNSDNGAPLLDGKAVRVLKIGTDTEPGSSGQSTDEGDQLILLQVTVEQAPEVVQYSGQLYLTLAKRPAPVNGSQS